MATTSLAAIEAFVASLEAGVADIKSGLVKVGGTIEQDIGAATVDVESLANVVIAAFSASGNVEAAIVAPIASTIEALINGAEALFGINGVAPVNAADSQRGPYGTNVGDDPDAGAIGG